jgi:hypothetical protein
MFFFTGTEPTSFLKHIDAGTSSCSRYNANFKLDQSVLAIHDSPLYFEISEDNHL